MNRDDCLALAICGGHVHSAPAPASQLCYHCCHAIEGTPVPMPVAFRRKTQEWKTEGWFCSWGCMARFNNDSNHRRKGERSMLIALMRHKTTGELGQVVSAPPRTCLQAFGGSMTIEEFRAQSPNGLEVEILPPKLIPLESVIHARKVEARPALGNLQQQVDLSTASAPKNETLRLKRPRPMPSSSDVLTRTMGLEIFVAK